MNWAVALVGIQHIAIFCIAYGALKEHQPNHEGPMPAKQPLPVLVTFARKRSAHITVVRTLSGKPARFIIDTGAGGTCIAIGALDAYGLTLKGRSQKGGGLASMSMQLMAAAKHDLHLVGINLSRYTLHALDLSHVNAGLAAEKVRPIVGVLGADILHDRQALIDYGRQLLVLGSTNLSRTNR